MSLKPYPEYKDSGVEWLGEVPKHWAVQPISAISRVITSTVDKKSYEGEIPVRLCNYTDVYYSDVVRDDLEYMKATATPAQIALFTPRLGDVAITKDSETSDDIGIPSYVPFDMPGIVFGYHLAIYRPQDTRYGRFFKYLFESKYVKVTFENRTPGVTRVGLSQNTLKYLRVPTPPVKESQAVADYLDRETAEIDAFIADQEELIALLAERRTATVTRAVTKGLNPDVPVKDSGTEWLGSIPEHWQTRKIKTIVTIPITDGPHETPEFLPEGVPFVSAEAVSSGNINFEKVRGFISEEDNLRFSKKYLPRKHDIFMVKSGATTGLCAIVDTDLRFNIWSPLAAIRCNQETSPRFLLHTLRSLNFQESVRLFWNYGTQQNIGMKVLENLPIPYPDLEEQKSIATYLDQEISEINAAIADARETIALSKERRAAVISAAVTGKIDVRGLVAPATNDMEDVSVGVA